MIDFSNKSSLKGFKILGLSGPLFSMRERNLKNGAGFTLIELIIAISVFAVGVLGPIALIQQSLRVEDQNRHKVVATYLAIDGLELVRAHRDDMIRDLRPWDTNLNECDITFGGENKGQSCQTEDDCTPSYEPDPTECQSINSTDFCIDTRGTHQQWPPREFNQVGGTSGFMTSTGNLWTTTCSNFLGENYHALCLNAQGYYKHCPKSDPNKSPYERYLELTRATDADGVEFAQVVSRVTWDNGNQQVEFTTNLYDWQKPDFAFRGLTQGYSWPWGKVNQVIDDITSVWGNYLGVIQGWEGTDNGLTGKFPLYCEGGDRDGEFCGDDYGCDDLVLTCEGGAKAGQVCTTNQDCLDDNRICVGGSNAGASCMDDSDCPGGSCEGDDGVCVANDGECTDYFADPLDRDENDPDIDRRDIDYSTAGGNPHFVTLSPENPAGFIDGELMLPGEATDYVLFAESSDPILGFDTLDLIDQGTISFWIFNTRYTEAFIMGHQVQACDDGNPPDAGTGLCTGGVPPHDFEMNPYAFGYGFSDGGAGCNPMELSFVMGSGSSYEVHCGNAIYDLATQLSNDEFFHVAVTWDLNEPFNNVKFYIDGEPAGTSTATIEPVHNAGQARVFGKSGVEINELPYWGRLSKTEIFRRALTDDEIKKLITGE